MLAMPLRWKLEELLEQHDLSAYRIAKQAEIGMTTIYRIKNNKTDTVQGQVLESILQALYDLTGKRYSVGDLLEWEPKEVHHGR
jgi:DNA-binding Xre family transcriptional regulator